MFFYSEILLSRTSRSPLPAIPRSRLPHRLGRQTQGLESDTETVYQLLQRDFASTGWGWAGPFPGQHQIISEDEQTRLVKGAMGKIERYWKHKSGPPGHVSFDCDNPEK